ncbi:uncharacterized protein LOC130444309 isoform X2 [Diorhabda sublineata]|uniref:uncharacterized protein LOC130444309 isoform X1 n=1 Tax=Diorhabda sublineata TaxID=1163346 RepID=UPI0024E15745|nr:uncharacterized protein LOC130444309 isoform X1 [Diorhabda sublineata]XP_056635365.1 uncharacterized protein LOC130444309 isoform X2 [Diorhabda sublineata]
MAHKLYTICLIMILIAAVTCSEEEKQPKSRHKHHHSTTVESTTTPTPTTACTASTASSKRESNIFADINELIGILKNLYAQVQEIWDMISAAPAKEKINKALKRVGDIHNDVILDILRGITGEDQKFSNVFDVVGYVLSELKGELVELLN